MALENEASVDGTGMDSAGVGESPQVQTEVEADVSPMKSQAVDPRDTEASALMTHRDTLGHLTDANKPHDPSPAEADETSWDEQLNVARQWQPPNEPPRTVQQYAMDARRRPSINERDPMNTDASQVITEEERNEDDSARATKDEGVSKRRKEATEPGPKRYSIDLEQLTMVMSDNFRTKVPIAEQHLFCDTVNEALLTYEIDTPRKIAAFIATMGFESKDFMSFESEKDGRCNEARCCQCDILSDGSTSQDGCANIYDYKTCCRQDPLCFLSKTSTDTPQEGDMGECQVAWKQCRALDLGNCCPGDGEKFKGRGALMIEGRVNYQLCANSLANQVIMSNPEVVKTDLRIAILCGAWFWSHSGLNMLADDCKFAEITKRLRQSTDCGAEDIWKLRMAYYDRAREVFHASQCAAYDRTCGQVFPALQSQLPPDARTG
eukprot:TRINITY_DN40056_c0_g1_i1.p1 TRINITY_DN40056_c0_g1~~TRINITY_DN40056_c0_g1_i1.p1  ORF type:complete len:509 (+),score=89.26 TRINITY_DN40056_c0_g1_i1:220-1527(+)